MRRLTPCVTLAACSSPLGRLCPASALQQARAKPALAKHNLARQPTAHRSSMASTASAQKRRLEELIAPQNIDMISSASSSTLNVDWTEVTGQNKAVNPRHRTPTRKPKIANLGGSVSSLLSSGANDTTTGESTGATEVLAHSYATIDATMLPRTPPLCGSTGKPMLEPRSIMLIAPSLADEWDWETAEQEGLSQTGIFPWVNFPPEIEVAWRCATNPDHRWKASAAQRLRDRSCPGCSKQNAHGCDTLLEMRPEIASEWHPEYNKANAQPPRGNPVALDGPDQISWDSSRTVWWQCPDGPDHVFQATVKARTLDGAVCPYCANKRVSVTNSLQSVFPEIAKEWHVELNGALTPDDVVFTSSQAVWWRTTDSAGRPIEWKAPVAKRTRHVRFMGILRQRARGDAATMAQQVEAVANTREKRRQARRARRQIIAAASACSKELKAARASSTNDD
eukprot:SAG31_NODE_833_length_11657_cov_3.652535_7_plen_453_part_00